jgi:TonB family protein
MDAIQPGGPPDQLPTVQNAELPFHYPRALYDQRVQANVVLRLYVDSAGRVVPDSTRVAETSNHSQLDSAAVTGSRELRFEPARRNGQPVGVAVLFPIFFRHPEEQPLPGDTVLRRDTTATPAP